MPMAEEYGVPACPVAAGAVKASGAAILIPQLILPVPPAVPVESTACAVKLKLPVTPGVPVIFPELSIIRPVGKEPAVREKVYGGKPPKALTAEE